MFDRQTIHPKAAAIAVAAVVAVLALSSCDADDDASPRKTTGQSVVAPGKPGEEARTLTAEEARKETVTDTPNSADYQYVQRMIHHHEQALVMTGLAERHAASPSVRRLAERISAGQKPEIAAMQGWLKDNDGEQRAAHDHTAMPGMATEAQLAQLKAARGKAFDRLFLTLMIAHHQGAITMATEALTDGNNVRVEEMATDVAAQQAAEIDRMRALQV
ncbi:DUF305 domain-containing protein [Streptomyces sp. NBC_00102]|uniref:DUF305 domain-containing protein n=1 Tax=Streptomyces sp. NBC_00102 TaxID=2975652 RepID=UPI00225873BB|nr:DUF305 domain-containing protein [Streptomyces sp. NBC_00102]MCX5401607.1 DUF305 domain-containing protein [Streptomyces sp. NBC_00102]